MTIRFEHDSLPHHFEKIVEPRAQDVLEAGRALDVRVAAMVMEFEQRPTEANAAQFVLVPKGWTDFSSKFWLGKDIHCLVPAYSRSIAVAWEVLEKLCDLGCWIQLQHPSGGAGAYWRLYVETPTAEGNYYAEQNLPLAICIAALNAVGALQP